MRRARQRVVVRVIVGGVVRLVWVPWVGTAHHVECADKPRRHLRLFSKVFRVVKWLLRIASSLLTLYFLRSVRNHTSARAGRATYLVVLEIEGPKR